MKPICPLNRETRCTPSSYCAWYTFDTPYCGLIANLSEIADQLIELNSELRLGVWMAEPQTHEDEED